MLSLPRRTADPFPWPPSGGHRGRPRSFAIREVLGEDEDDEDGPGKDDWLAEASCARALSLSRAGLAGNTLSFANPRVHVTYIFSSTNRASLPRFGQLRPLSLSCLLPPQSFVISLFFALRLFVPSLSFSLPGIASDAFSLLNAPPPSPPGVSYCSLCSSFLAVPSDDDDDDDARWECQ